MASYFQSYFQASSMPKRLLQYALSRLEILETDALDLENLDIAWGKNSVFEFRDVGLRLRKLEALLQLPQSFELVKSRVLLLKVTIPVDIYSSPIIVEVDGVDCQIRVLPQPDKNPPWKADQAKKRKHEHKQSEEGVGEVDETEQKGLKPIGTEDTDHIIPTAADLAQSFLQGEPKEERAELEAVILSETQDLSSSVSSNDDDEFGEGMGTGTTLSLPTFIARFLQGIADRLQVRIRGITINLDLDVQSDTATSPSINETDPVTLQLRVGDIDIEGVTRGSDTLKSNEERSDSLYKDGKRLIRLSNIRGAIISEANLFSSFAPSSAMSSPAVTNTGSFEDKLSPVQTQPSTRNSQLSMHNSESSIRNSQLSIHGVNEYPDITSDAPSSIHSSTQLPTEIDDSHSLKSSTVSDTGRFDDASEAGEQSDLGDSIHGSDISESMLQNSAFLDQTLDSRFLEYAQDQESTGSHLPVQNDVPVASRSSTPTPSIPKASINALDSRKQLEEGAELEGGRPLLRSTLQSTLLPSRPHSRFSSDRISKSQSLPIAPLPLVSYSIDHINGQEELDASYQYDSRSTLATTKNDQDDGDDDEPSPMGQEDLTESQLFSHEDAESMYMSALSYGSSSVKATRDLGSHAILRASSHDEASPSPTVRAIHISSEQQLDNLDDALHAAAPQEKPNGNPTSGHYTAISKSARALESSPTLTSNSSMAQEAPTMPGALGNSSDRSEASSEHYTRITKQILGLNHILIYVPASMTSEPTNDIDYGSSSPVDTLNTLTEATRTMSMNVPGAFSIHLPPTRAPPQNQIPIRPPDKPIPTQMADDGSIEISFGELSILFDSSLGKLMIRLVTRLKEALKQTSSKMKKGKENSSQEITGLDLKINADLILIKLLDRLEGRLGSASNPSEAHQWANPAEVNSLLQSSIRGLRIHTEISQLLTKTTISLQKFVFGHSHEKILSFDAGLQMRSSVRDLKGSAGIDVSVNIIQTSDAIRVKVVTLPVHVSIDLRRLDETFSWFGGLSSVLSLGNSIASNATVTPASQNLVKPRGVRFDTPISPDDKSSNILNKVDVRLGGFVLDLIGTECSVGLETSAIKIVSRDEGLGVGIERISLSGPHIHNSDSEPAITAEVVNTRVEFLASPKDSDLERLLSLINPSKTKYDDDDILLGTLFRQRKQGAVLRLTLDDVRVRLERLEDMVFLPKLGEEISRLSTVAKYLPEDDRPGMLSLVEVRSFSGYAMIGKTLGSIDVSLKDIQVAHITFPVLIALSIHAVSGHRNGSEELFGLGVDPQLLEPRPAIMTRMIGDEMEPVIKIKLWNVKVEYSVPTLLAFLGLADTATAMDASTQLAASVATLTELASISKSKGKEISKAEQAHSPPSKPMKIDIALNDCIIGLNPISLPSKVIVVLSEAHLTAELPKDSSAHATVDLGKASVLVIDDVKNLITGSPSPNPKRQSFDGGNSFVTELCSTGWVSVSYISSAKATVRVTSIDDEPSIDVELRDDLFVLESCADSTQTLAAVFGGLSPPTPPSKETKYRTKVIPVKDLLSSLSGDAFGTAEGDYDFDKDFGLEDLEADEDGILDFDSHYYQHDAEDDASYKAAILEDKDESLSVMQLSVQDTPDGVLLESFLQPAEPEIDDPLDFNEDHFGTGSTMDGTAHRWNSTKNTYDRSNIEKVRHSPLKVCVRDMHLIWNLFDGYDWQHTRDTINKAVQDVESKAFEKRTRNERKSAFERDIDDDDETVIGDFLFNSIYIGIPANRDPRELTTAINQELNDNATETESLATTTFSSSPSRQGTGRRGSTKRLRLKRSKHHKITFELRGVCADIVAFPPDSGETQSSIDIRVHDFEVFDHVPTSTWRKFATYMQEAGERETGSNMMHIEILNVKPMPELAASEIVLKATVLPLRLHVDQDALDFITRFFEFKDNSVVDDKPPGDVPFIQRVEVNSIAVKLDFKPKRVDYAGLRSGHTTEFMNFLILDEADMVLRHTIIYGVSGFDKMGKCLNDIWMPDIKRHQLPGILAGLAPVRSLANVGGGFRHLVLIPMHEYQKDGRIVRGISKGAAAFAKTTGTELVKLGAKVAIGVQTVLQGAEDLLSHPGTTSMASADDDDSEEENRKISLYANQPVGVLQGLRGGYTGLQRDLVLARDAIIAVPGEVMEEGSAAGVLKAVRKHAPTVILRPAIGVAKAGGQILMGATNSLDPVNLQRADAKYKKY